MILKFHKNVFQKLPRARNAALRDAQGNRIKLKKNCSKIAEDNKFCPYSLSFERYDHGLSVCELGQG
jgi:hypothetical protein